MEEFSFSVEGVGRMRIADQTITVPKHGGVLVGPELLRQVFNDTEAHALWLIVGAPEKELQPGVGLDQKLVDPMDPKQLPPAVGGTVWQDGHAAAGFDFGD